MDALKAEMRMGRCAWHTKYTLNDENEDGMCTTFKIKCKMDALKVEMMMVHERRVQINMDALNARITMGHVQFVK